MTHAYRCLVLFPPLVVWCKSHINQSFPWFLSVWSVLWLLVALPKTLLFAFLPFYSLLLSVHPPAQMMKSSRSHHCRVYGPIPLRLSSTSQKRLWAWTWIIKASALHHSFSAIRVWGGEKVANWNKLYILALWTQPVSVLISATKETEEVQNSLACEHDINVHVKKKKV